MLKKCLGLLKRKKRLRSDKQGSSTKGDRPLKARVDHRTKDLVKRARPGEVAFIDHEDVDRVSAEGLIKAKVDYVVNTSETISGRYPNPGPILLLDAGITVIDGVGRDVFAVISEGDSVTISGGKILHGDEEVAHGELLTREKIKDRLELAEVNLAGELEAFAMNTLEYLKTENTALFGLIDVPPVKAKIAGNHALVVVRGHAYETDLRVLTPYIKEMRPVLIAVDGGADALLSRGLTPDIIVGDMDSVSDSALRSGADLIVHAFPDGRAPGSQRLDELGLEHITFAAAATSEDIALILAYEHGAELIVAVGTHTNLVDFLDKGRKGMASTFLTKLKVGRRLVDAKGVGEIYKSRVQTWHLSALMIAGVAAISTIILVSPSIKHLITLFALRARWMFGF